jgi:hypothetical protein
LFTELTLLFDYINRQFCASKPLVTHQPTRVKLRSFIIHFQ